MKFNEESLSAKPYLLESRPKCARGVNLPRTSSENAILAFRFSKSYTPVHTYRVNKKVKPLNVIVRLAVHPPRLLIELYLQLADWKESMTPCQTQLIRTSVLNFA